MVALRVEMGDELGHGTGERSFTEQQELGQTLLLYGSASVPQTRSDSEFWRKLEAVNARMEDKFMRRGGSISISRRGVLGSGLRSAARTWPVPLATLFNGEPAASD